MVRQPCERAGLCHGEALGSAAKLALKGNPLKPLALPIIVWNRVRHVIRERKRIAVLESTIKTIRTELDRAKKNEMPHFQRIHNVSLYVLVFEYDFAILRDDALFAVRKWRKAFVARQLAVLLYEAAHDLPELLGKEFRESLKTLSLPDIELRYLNGITKQIGQFKDEHRDVLNEIRNFVSAHRDKDAGRQLEIIEKVDLLKIMRLASQFYEALRDLTPFLTRTTLLLSDHRVIIKHLQQGCTKPDSRSKEQG